jgi:drug/metabolite transporter (DMT)-like permease
MSLTESGAEHFPLVEKCQEGSALYFSMATTASLYIVLGVVSFAGMGIVHKLGDRYSAKPLHIAFITMGTSCLLSFVLSFVAHSHPMQHLPAKVVVMAIPFGTAAAAALWFFQSGLRYGHIATSWLVINLSSAIPTVLSVCIYHESLSRRKLIVLVLIATSLILLWWDRRHGESTAMSVVPDPVEGGA